MEKTKMELGEEYGFAGYKWVPVEIDEDHQVAVMQSLGVTSGPWPGYSMEKFGDGYYYNKDITGEDISEYDDKTRALMKQIKPIAIASSTGLYLPSYKNIKDNPVWKDAFAKAAGNYSSFGASSYYAWTGIYGGYDYACVVNSDGGTACYNQDSSYVVAPFFVIELSKVKIEGDEIKAKSTLSNSECASLQVSSLKEKVKDLEELNARLNDFIQNGTITATGRLLKHYSGKTVWSVNVSDILTRLIKEAGRLCDNYASDLFIDWTCIQRDLDTGVIEPGVHIFAFRENGMDGKPQYDARCRECGKVIADRVYRSIWELEININEDKIDMKLSRKK